MATASAPATAIFPALRSPPGRAVHRGDVIGYVGESGRSTGPHLHYEVRINDTPVNPYKYLRMTVAHNGGFACGKLENRFQLSAFSSR